MLILTVLALARLVSAENGYNYDVPRTPINQPTNSQTGNSYQSTGSAPVKSFSYTMSDNRSNIPQGFKPATVQNNYAQPINSGPKLNNGFNAVPANPANSFSNGPIQNFNLGNSLNSNYPNTVTNINHITTNTGLTNLASQNILNNLVPAPGTNTNSGYSNTVSYQSNLHKSLVQNSNSVISSNIPNNIPVQGINSNGVYSQSTYHNTGSHSVGSGFSNSFNGKYTNNDQHNTAYSPNLNSHGTNGLNIYSVNQGVNSIPQILMPPFENSLNTGILPLQNTNNVNTNSFPPTSSGDAGISQSFVPITNTDSSRNNYNRNPNIINGVTTQTAPNIMKSIYFHVPPPDIEEPAIRTLPPPPPKKTYKILFIKVPSQESVNTIRLQQLAQQKAAVDVKTLIYVLVRKPESVEPTVKPQNTKTDHEVFFVKYNGQPEEIVSQIDRHIEGNSIQSISPILQPGLTNGQKQEQLRGDQGTL